MTDDQIIPLASLAIAALAVFVGPLVSFYVARRQIESSQLVALGQVESSQRVAMRQVVAPMRQAWINALRDKVSEICADAEYCCYATSIGEDVPDYTSHARRLYRLEKEISLTINPLEDDHKALVKSISRMLYCIQTKKIDDFGLASRETMKLTQGILKTEWNSVKNEL
jgi:hypothetical protein